MKKIIVIKIGSSVLMTKRNKLDEFRVSHIAKQVQTLQQNGFAIVLVISGAVAYGSCFVDLSSGKKIVKQAAAGIGQIYLTTIFNNIFVKNNLQLAQILLAKSSIKEKLKREKLRGVISLFASLGFVSFINENDVIDLNSFGGNDLLAAKIALLINAEKLLILSTMKGSSFGVGGGATKTEAKQMLIKENIHSNILDGKVRNAILHSVL